MRSWSSSLIQIRKVWQHCGRYHDPQASLSPYQQQSDFCHQTQTGSGHQQVADGHSHHSSKRIIFSSKVLGEVLDSISHQSLNTNTLFLGDSGRKTKSINGATNTDSARVDRDILSNISLQLCEIHVRSVLGRCTDSMVFLNEGVKHWSKVLIGVPITSIDTAMLIVECNSTSNCLSKSKSRGLGLDVLKLIPFLLCHMLGN